VTKDLNIGFLVSNPGTLVVKGEESPESRSIPSGTRRVRANPAAIAGVEQLSHVQAKELGPRGITVNVVSPGPTDTELFGQGKTEQDKQRFAQMAALGRLGRPEDIADVVALLVSEEARWITGQNIRANGGLI
jgi:NAD(P)-dependent dehydrogenase (short-subunit alcohol dehydrogenase family)